MRKRQPAGALLAVYDAGTSTEYAPSTPSCEPSPPGAHMRARIRTRTHRHTSIRTPPRSQRLDARQPIYKLDHLIRERYPTFVDGLRDLDDAPSLVHLFARL